jgi:EAL domain-containing protein (putative c-di-GMP-specific phosphodiesterase class I)/GGDEF domain-containing protein
LHGIVRQRQLTALFQPIVNIDGASIFGHEGLIRGPADSHLHFPLDLFAEARKHGMSVEVEHLSRQIVIESYARSAATNKLFLNVSPECFMQPNAAKGSTLAYIHQSGLDSHNVVIELTENSPTLDYNLLRKAAEHYRSMGFEIAMDDLGEGFSSLRLWSELRPDYVKIDKHFIHGINADPVKLEFVRSIQQIAQNSGAKVIAEGIETQAELVIIKDLNIAYGQGYFLGRPLAHPLQDLALDLDAVLRKNCISVYPGTTATLRKSGNISRLVKYLPPVMPQTSSGEVYALFESNPMVYSLPVVTEGKPVGLISRYSMIDRFARRYTRELYEKKPCDAFMDAHPLIVEKSMSLHELSDLITHMEPHHLSNGFIVTDSGSYLGMGSGHALLQEITKMQIMAARYANPLTMLPGNVPVSEHLDRLLDRGITFWACYCDLDNFKPFNDAYGFRRGDELIQFTGRVLSNAVINEIDFVGHIGGDDFIVIFQSEDWESRCVKILDTLKESMPDFYDLEDRQGGIVGEDRQGRKVCYPIVSLSIGAVKIEPAMFASHHEVSAAIASAKKQAKAFPGNSLFLERRMVASAYAAPTGKGIA